MHRIGRGTPYLWIPRCFEDGELPAMPDYLNSKVTTCSVSSLNLKTSCL